MSKTPTTVNDAPGSYIWGKPVWIPCRGVSYCCAYVHIMVRNEMPACVKDMGPYFLQQNTNLTLHGSACLSSGRCCCVGKSMTTASRLARSFVWKPFRGALGERKHRDNLAINPQISSLVKPYNALCLDRDLWHSADQVVICMVDRLSLAPTDTAESRPSVDLRRHEGDVRLHRWLSTADDALQQSEHGIVLV